MTNDPKPQPPPAKPEPSNTDRHQEQDDFLEEALEETFPASDPISPGHIEKKPH